MGNTTRFLLFTIILLLVTGCAEQPVAPTVTSTITPAILAAPPTPTKTPFQVAGHTPTPAFTHTAAASSASAPACPETRGTLLREQIASDLLPEPLIYQLYLPPCFASSKESLPVLILFHGFGYTDSQWPDLGVVELADARIASGDAQPFIILMPFEQETHLRPYGSNFGQAIIQTLLPNIERRYPACSHRACRAIGGISRGGNWAIQLGFTYWELFGAIGAHSAPLFNEDAHALDAWFKDIPPGDYPRIYVDIGQNDPLYRDALFFHRQLDEHGIIHTWRLNPRGHSDAYWQLHIEDYLEWYILDPEYSTIK